ncbi:glutamate 5-kinase [Candidatus Soleaferrea massiliensis]|uniref:glutamate 5-kinase n=1 Tax=Candidatus Soleaferrea massiliensis TaxID=1470354 RepID=UPI00058EC678|nr:glutamate 5-kinase [Candidatus Soleaferrea massiliensis]
MSCFSEAKRIVIKVGTSALTHESGLFNIRRIEKLVKVLADLKNSGREVILVSSGAIGVGVGRLGLKEKPQDIPSKQACAAVGQCELMYLYDKMFSEYNHTVAQLLLTKDIVADENKKRRVINTMESLLGYNAIPVVNENDTVSIAELKFGDNDTLSALVAVLCKADVLVILSDIDGLYDGDPRKDPDATLIETVPVIDENIAKLAGGVGSTRGTGGMITKVQAAKYATKHHIDVAIINGLKPYNLYKLFDGEKLGTHFPANPVKVKPKK